MTDIKEIALLAVNAAKSKKAQDVKLLDVRELTIIADFLLFAVGRPPGRWKRLPGLSGKNWLK